MSGLFLVLASTFDPRPLKGKLQLGPTAGLEFELAKQGEARVVTTTMAATPDPMFEVGPNQEHDATRSTLVDLSFVQLFETERWDDLSDCRFQLYLYDPDLMMLLPIRDR